MPSYIISSMGYIDRTMTTAMTDTKKSLFYVVKQALQHNLQHSSAQYTSILRKPTRPNEGRYASLVHSARMQTYYKHIPILVIASKEHLELLAQKMQQHTTDFIVTGPVSTEDENYLTTVHGQAFHAVFCKHSP